MPKKREKESNHWQVHLCETCYQEPCEFCKACVCPCVYAGCQRYELLDHNLDNYTCCAGICGDCFDPCTSPCPGCCLVVEVSVCCWLSIAGNRSMIQNTYGIRNTKCEDCMICCACVFSFVWCIINIFFNVPDGSNMVVDCFYLALSACFQSQQHAEMEYQSKKHAPHEVEMKKM